MPPYTLSNATIIVENSTGAVTGVVTYDSATKTVTFNPVTNLEYNETYNVTITTGVQDLAGNNMTSDFSWNFTTAMPSSTIVYIAEVSAPPGGSITVPIMINNVTDLGGGEINVTYNSSIVHVTNVTGGDMTLTAHNINNASGLVYLNAISTIGQSGDVVFANINLTAGGNATDACPLNISVYAFFDCHYPYPEIHHTVTNGTFTIISPGVTPTPTPPPSTGDGGGDGGGSATPTPTHTPTEKPPAVEKVLKIISSIEAGKTESVTFEGLDVCKINIEVDKYVSDVKVMVEKVDKPEEITEAPGIVYSYYNITATNLTDVNVTAKIEFKVNKSWIADDNVDEVTIRLNRYDEEWKALPTSKIKDDDSYFYFSAETQGFLIFAISGTKKIGVATTPSPTETPLFAPTFTPPASATPTQTPSPIIPTAVIKVEWILVIGLMAVSIMAMIIYVVFKYRSGSDEKRR